MATFIQILSIWPISNSISSNLSLGDLLILSRLSTATRCALHGLPFLHPSCPVDPKTNTRPQLCIGSHQNSYWKGNKMATLKECSEPGHTKGGNPQCCRRCSMPVCEACIIKENWKKNEPTYKNRCRYLCVECWNSGRPHVGRHPRGRYRHHHRGSSVNKGGFGDEGDEEEAVSYNFAPGTGDFCVCTVKDGWLCRTCKTQQNAEARNITACVGEGCHNQLDEDRESRRICLWCDLPLIKRQNRMGKRESSMLYKYAYEFEAYLTRDGKLPERGAHAGRRGNPSTAASELGVQSRLSGVEMRRLERLLKSDDTGPHYVRHLAAIDYKAFGARKPSRKRIVDSMQGIFKYDQDFLLQFEQVCTKAPSADWWVWMMRLMLDKQGTPPDVEDDASDTGHVLNEKTSTSVHDEGHEVEGQRRSHEKGKAKEIDPPNLDVNGDVCTGSLEEVAYLADRGDYKLKEEGVFFLSPSLDEGESSGDGNARAHLPEDKKSKDEPGQENGSIAPPEPDDGPPRYEVHNEDLLLNLYEPSSGAQS